MRHNTYAKASIFSRHGEACTVCDDIMSHGREVYVNGWRVICGRYCLAKQVIRDNCQLNETVRMQRQWKRILRKRRGRV